MLLFEIRGWTHTHTHTSASASRATAFSYAVSEKNPEWRSVTPRPLLPTDALLCPAQPTQHAMEISTEFHETSSGVALEKHIGSEISPGCSTSPTGPPHGHLKRRPHGTSVLYPFFSHFIDFPSSRRKMGAGAVATGGASAAYDQLIDPNRKWYNNSRYVVVFFFKSAVLFNGDDRLIKLNLWILLLLITSSTNGYDGSMMNGLQSVKTWAAYFGKPNDSTLGLLNAIQVRLLCCVMDAIRSILLCRVSVPLLVTRSPLTSPISLVVVAVSGSARSSCVSPLPSRPLRLASACSSVPGTSSHSHLHPSS